MKDEKSTKKSSGVGSFVAGAAVGAAAGGGAVFASNGGDLDDLKEFFTGEKDVIEVAPENAETAEVQAGDVTEDVAVDEEEILLSEDDVTADEYVAEDVAVEEESVDNKVKLEVYLNDRNQEVIDAMQQTDDQEKLENFINDLNAEQMASVNDVEEPVEVEIKQATTVNDSMTFDEAFIAARAELGAGGVFEWHGEQYNTYVAEEWEAMTAEEKDAFEDNVLALNEPEVNPEVVVADSNAEDTEGGIQYIEEHDIVINEITTDGDNVVLVDLDGDGVDYEVALVDADGDGIISQDEVIDLKDDGLDVAALDIDTPDEMAFDEDMAFDEEMTFDDDMTFDDEMACEDEASDLDEI